MADFTITLSNNPIPFNPSEAHRLQFKFIVKDSQYSTTEEHTLIDFGDFELGNDDDDETVYFPGNIKVEFQLNTTLEKFENILLELKSKKTIAQIFKNGVKIFSGYVYQKDVSGMQYTRRVNITIIDQFKELENWTAKTQGHDGIYFTPFNYNLTANVKVVDLIKDLLIRPEVFDDPYIEEVVSLCTLECQAVINSVLTDVPFVNFATKYGYHFSQSSLYNNCLEALKAILTSYGCIGIVGFDKKFYIIPRRYNGSATFELSRENMMEEPEANIVPKRKRIILNVFATQPGETEAKFEQMIEGRDYNETATDHIVLMDAGGNLPQSGKPPAYALAIVGGVTYNVELNSYRNKKPDGTYTDRKALYKIIFDDLWACIRYDRRSYNVKATGNYETLTFGQYYYFEDSTDRFYRLRKASYSLKGKDAKLSLIDSTIIPIAITSQIVFDVIMEAQNSETEINGVRYSGTSNQLRIGAQNVFAIIDNMYASTVTSIKRYDGTVVTIPDDQASELYKTTEAYLIYLAISKTGNDPEFSYPNPDDSNANWYLLTQFPDQKIYDPDYEYKVLLPKIKAGKMKYWLWMGMKSIDAKIFDKIPLYSPGVIIDKTKVQ